MAEKGRRVNAAGSGAIRARRSLVVVWGLEPRQNGKARIMRTTLALISMAALASAAACADSIAKFEERPFFARRPGTVVPPPQFYASTEEVLAGAEVRVKVVQCPDKAGIDFHHFIGGPVFSTGVVKSFTDLTADQSLSFKLDDKMRIGVTAKIGGEAATCKEVERKDGKDVMKYAVGDQELVVEVEVVGK
jgi:hypothetical protein